MNGLIAVDKPSGLTSRQISARVGRFYGIRQAGHTGTLDPLASGVLPVMLGRACKLIQFLPDKKAYIANMRFGIKTDTGDITGNITEQNDFVPDRKAFESIINEFTGEITQIPPMYSALKKDGVPLYKLARRGEKVEVKARRVRIDSIKLLSFNGNECAIEVYCGGGTYIRTLCEDMAERCGTVAAMTSLRRIMDCGVRIENCFTLEEIEEGKAVPVTPEELFDGLECVAVPENGKIYYLNGGPIDSSRLDKTAAEGLYRVYSEDKEFLGLGILKENMLKSVWLNTEG